MREGSGFANHEKGIVESAKESNPMVGVLRSRDSFLAEKAITLIRGAARILEYTVSTFPGGTDHTHRHTHTVERIARMMLSDEFLASLSSEEIYFLTLACHYHDLAMAGTEADDADPTSREQVRRDHALRIGRIIAEKWKISTPDFKEDLRSQVFQKSLAAIAALRIQAIADGVSAKLPDLVVEWKLKEIWELLLPLSSADMRPRSVEEIAQRMLKRYQESVTSPTDLRELCHEVDTADSELLAQISRCVADAVSMGHLQKDPDHEALFLLSTKPEHASVFFLRTIKADELDLLYLGRFRETWEQELFGSAFGRVYIRKTVIPAVKKGYSVQLSQRPPSDPTRALLELCPTAARIARDHSRFQAILLRRSC